MRKLVIFDVDGTLVDAHPIDNDSFDQAFRKGTGKGLTADMWTTFEEVTAKAIVHQALGRDRDDLDKIEMHIRDLFLDGLRSHLRAQPASIRATVGSMSMMTGLRANAEFGTAIATGCWHETAHFKLGAAGFDITNLPFACASDCYARADIIELSAKRAGFALEHVVYVGDGVWDLKASRKLGIPFVGVGRKVDTLREAGAEYVLGAWEELESVLPRVFGRRN